MTPRFPARVTEDGMLVPVHPERTRRYAGKEVWISLHEKPAPMLRSDQANKYMWSVVYGEIAKETGGDVNSIHYGLKREALRLGILEPQFQFLGDRLVEDDPSTRTDSVTFWNYIGWIRHEAEHGTLLGTVEAPWPLHIPEPNEGESDEFGGAT